MPNRDPTAPSNCRSCGAPMLWVVWPNSGKRMPVDFDPVPDGDVVLTLKKTEGVLWAAKAAALDAEALVGRRRFVSHFATCANADEHRRPRE